MNSLERARALQQRAVNEFAAAHPARARSLGRRALGLLDAALPSIADAELRRTVEQQLVRTLISLSNGAAELDGPAAGLALIDRAESIAARLNDAELAFLARSQRASLAIRTGDLSSAAIAYQRARDHLAAASDYDRAVILVNSGTVHLYLGQLPAARALLEQAVGDSAAAGLVLEQAKARHNLGYVDFLAGRLPDALAQMARALEIAPQLPRGVPLLDRARVLVEAGLVREADAALAEAAEIFRRDRLAQDRGETELERARCALITGDAAAARRFALRACGIFERRKADRWRRSAELVLLQADLAAGRSGVRLVEPALRLRAEFAADGSPARMRTATLLAAHADLAGGSGELARVLLTDLRPARRTEPITLRLHEAAVRAAADERSKRPVSAARRIRTALAELARYQASFGSLDLAGAAALHGRRLAELDLSLALRSGRPDRILVATERGRAVTARLPVVRPPDDPVAAQLLAELRQTVENLRAGEFDRAAAAPLLRRRRELEAELIGRSWTRTGSGAVLALADIAAVRASLRDKTLVSFVRSGRRLHAVIVGASRISHRPLGATDDIDEQLRRLRADLDVLAPAPLPGPLRAAAMASLRRSLARLDDALLAPLGVRGPLIVASTGLLGRLPWGLLPSLRGVPVVVAPSATAWHNAITRPASRARRVVAVAGPAVDRGAAEAAAVAQLWRGRLLAGATGADVRGALAGARVVHIAAHGVHQTENPLFSFLRLSDGPLFAHEFDPAERPTEHVVLSACEAGLATVRPGDEALGLTSVLLQLGTRSVIAGVGRVGDEIAETVMIDYHRRLVGGADSATALSAALEAADGSGSVAPFVCFGASVRPAQLS